MFRRLGFVTRWSATFPLAAVFSPLELAGMNIVVPRPDTPTVSLGILESFKVAIVGFVAVQYPCPSVNDHLELDVSPNVSAPSDHADEALQGRSWCNFLLTVGAPQVRDGNDPPMPVNNATRIHFQQYNEIEP